MTAPIKKIIKVPKKAPDSPVPIKRGAKEPDGIHSLPPLPPEPRPRTFLQKCAGIVVQDIRNLPSRIIYGKKKKEYKADPLSAAWEHGKRGGF